MTHLVNITLSYTSSRELLISAQSAETKVEAYSPLSAVSDDLIHELRGGRATNRAFEQSQKMVSEVLFSGKVGELIDELLRQPTSGDADVDQGEPTAEASKSQRADKLRMLIMLSAPDELHEWPWELARSLTSSRPLLLDGVELVRVTGEATTRSELDSLEVRPVAQVVTKSSEMFKFSAMRAATAHIARRFQVKVSAVHAQPEPSLSARERTLLSHLYAIDKQGMINLEAESAQPLTLGASGFARESYLLNITPRVPQTSVISARRSGALAIVARQFEQSVKMRAESDRALYHALGADKSIVEAVHWARETLARSDAKGYQWATLTLTSCEVLGGSPLVTLPFPPVRESAEAQVAESPHSSPPLQERDEAKEGPAVSAPAHELIEGGVKLAKRRRDLPIPAERFVKDTVTLIQRSQQSQDPQDKLALALRTPVMRHLSERVQARKIAPNPQLSRSAQLSRQLIEASFSDDRPLALPPQWLGRVERLASSVGVKIDAVAQAARALIASPAVWISGVDHETRLLLARGLCEEVFNASPYEPPRVDALQTPDHNLNRVTEGLSASAKLSWAPETNGIRGPQDGQRSAQEINPLTESLQDLTRAPRRCQITVGYQPERDAWRPFERVWTLIDEAEGLSLSARRLAHQAVKSGALEGQQIPRALRLIYLSDARLPESFEDAEVTIQLKPDLDRLPHLWKQRVRVELSERGAESEEVEARASSPETHSLSESLILAIELNLISQARAYDALLYGALMGGDAASCSEALELYLEPLINAATHQSVERDCLVAFMGRDLESYELCWRSLFSSEPSRSLPPVALFASE